MSLILKDLGINLLPSDIDAGYCQKKIKNIHFEQFIYHQISKCIFDVKNISYHNLSCYYQALDLSSS